MKPIPGFSTDYFADKQGNIWSTKRSSEPRRLKPGKSNGYFYVTLCKNKESHHSIYIGILVLRTFVGPCPEGMECCHNDGIKTHNELSNLRWDTDSNNMKDKIKHGTDSRGERNGLSVLTEADVIEIRRLIETGEITQTEVGKMYNVDKGTISQLKRRKTWTHI